MNVPWYRYRTEGKSEAAFSLAVAQYLHNPEIKIACLSENTYNLLKQHIPEANLIQAWENKTEEFVFWFDELLPLDKTILKEFK